MLPCVCIVLLPSLMLYFTLMQTANNTVKSVLMSLSLFQRHTCKSTNGTEAHFQWCAVT